MTTTQAMSRLMRKTKLELIDDFEWFWRGDDPHEVVTDLHRLPKRAICEVMVAPWLAKKMADDMKKVANDASDAFRESLRVATNRFVDALDGATDEEG